MALSPTDAIQEDFQGNNDLAGRVITFGTDAAGNPSTLLVQ